MRIALFFCLALYGAFSTNQALAQFDLGAFNSDFQPTISLNPEFPQPGEEVTATISQFEGALYGSTITWVLNGKEVPNSKNQREVKIVAGEAGETYTLDVVFTTPNGQRSFVSKEIKPFWLDIVIEPQTHVPEFYLGRALPSLGSMVVARAIINSDDYVSGNLIYKWSVNNQVVGGGTIRGQSVVSYETPIGDFATLSLEVSTLNGKVVAKKNISIPSVPPKILFYEVNTLLGISNKAIKSPFQLSDRDSAITIIRAEPMNLDSKVYNNPDIHEWKIGNQTTSNSGGNPYEIMLEKTGNSGYTNMRFHVRSLSQVLQGARGDLGINL